MKTLSIAALLLITTNVSANIFIEKPTDINHTTSLQGNYYYDTNEHDKILTVGYTSNHAEVSTTYIKSKYMNDTFSTNLSVHTDISNIRLSVGTMIVDSDYYPSDVSIGSMSVIPEVELHYIGLGKLQPAIKINSNEVVTASIRLVF